MTKNEFIKNQQSFTREQADFICYIIGKWYLLWKDEILVHNGSTTHRLGIAKEALKKMLVGGGEGDREDDS